MGIELTEWTGRLREEYLSDFIPSGGAAVKIAVAPPEWSSLVLQSLAREAGTAGFLVAQVDSARVKIQMVDQIFQTVARQINWSELTGRWVRGVLRNNGIPVAEDRPLSDLDSIAAESGRSRTDLSAELYRLITNSITTIGPLTREFRTAITLLCLGQVNPQNVSPTDADVVQQWLCGEKCSLATLKRLQIFGRIGRHNARALLASLAVWLRQVEYSGLALLLDLNAVLMASPPPETLVRYSRSATLDVYEVLRQFIDDVDETTYLLVGVVASPGLVDDPKRSVDNYSALKLRIIDDVRDRERANPLNAMVRLGNSEEPYRGL